MAVDVKQLPKVEEKLRGNSNVVLQKDTENFLDGANMQQGRVQKRTTNTFKVRIGQFKFIGDITRKEGL